MSNPVLTFCKRYAVPLGVSLLGATTGGVAWLAGASTFAQALWALAGLFVLCDAGVRGARVCVRLGIPVFGLAGAMLDEAIHRHLVRWVAAVLCLSLVALAFGANVNERLDYAERFFIEWSQMVIEFALALLTLVLASRSVSAEYVGKQIHTNLTKPVGRFAYLGGKWLGLMLLNGVLLSVLGLGIWTFTRVIESRWLATSTLSQDAKIAEVEATHRTLLAARFETNPAMENPQALSGYFYERLATMVQNGQLEANGSVQKKLQEAQASGRWPAPETFKSLMTRREYGNCMELATGKWYTLGAPEEGSLGEPSQVYMFSGLFEPMERAKAARAKVEAQLQNMGLTGEDARTFIHAVLLRQSPLLPKQVKAWYAEKFPKYQSDFTAMSAALQAERLQLTLVPNAGGALPRDGWAELRVEAGGLPLIPMEGSQRKALLKAGVGLQQVAMGHRLLPIAQPTSLEVPADRINESGRLKVRITKPLVNGRVVQPTILFDTSSGIKLYGHESSFGRNLVAAFTVLLVKLGFLAMLGLVCGALFSFPVACLTALAVYALAAYADGLQESFEDFVTLGRKPSDGIGYYFMWLKTLTRESMQQVLKCAPHFGDYNARRKLVDGVVVSWVMVGQCVLVLGALWTGLTALVGGFLFLRREIARVIV